MSLKFKECLKSKSEHYAQIDKFRAFRLYERYKKAFCELKIIQIIGTNGKGSTGRFLAQLLNALNVSVAHYTSPHIFEFKERFWQNGRLLSDDELNLAHETLAKMMSDEDLQSLSYFEYATFLAALSFKKCDFVVFEAGLGAEFDATSVFDKILSVFTPISYDHTQILGANLLGIARTKLKVMAQKAVISSTQEEAVLNLAHKIALLKNATLYESDKFIALQDKEFTNALKNYTTKHKLPKFLQENLKTALCALNLLTNSQKNLLFALNSLKSLDLRGRCEQLAPNIIIDVGHNPQAAKAISQHFKGQKFILVYNSFLDKDIFEILKILKPLIDKITLYDYISERALAKKEIKSIAKALNIECDEFRALEKDKKYLVFGSFLLVENFVRENVETTKI